MATNGKKVNATLVKELQSLIDAKYQQTFIKGTSVDDFCHAIYEFIGELNDKKGGIQLKLPTQEELNKIYKEYKKEKGQLTTSEFNKIVKEIITLDSFTVGKRVLDGIAILFGVPISAFFAKRFVPGGASVSDDILISAVTSLTAVALAKTNML